MLACKNQYPAAASMRYIARGHVTSAAAQIEHPSVLIFSLHLRQRCADGLPEGDVAGRVLQVGKVAPRHLDVRLDSHIVVCVFDVVVRVSLQ